MWMQYTNAELRQMNVLAEDDTVMIDRTVRFYGKGPFHIGKHTRIDAYTVITCGDIPVEIGRHIHIAVGVYLQGTHGLKMGLATFIAAGSRIFTGSEDYVNSPLIGPTTPEWSKILRTGPVCFEDGSGLGANVVVLPGVTIGQGATVGALALVNRNIQPFTIAAGTPAKSIGSRPQREIETVLQRLRLEDAQ